MCNSNCTKLARQPQIQSTNKALLSEQIVLCVGNSSDEEVDSVFHLPLHRNPSIPELISVDNNNRRGDSSSSKFCDCDARPNEISCDACSFCNDTCTNSACRDCRSKCDNDPFLSVSERRISTCELQRHDNLNSAWLLIDRGVYDVTAYIERHPGGTKSILKYSGGVKNCREDMDFHSKGASRMLKAYKIGRIVECPGKVCRIPGGDSNNDACSIM